MVTRIFLNNKKSMKKIILIIAAIITSATLNAQDKDVTKFLGIPVDGTKAAMIQKLKAKGFKRISYDSDVMEGEFNGEDVYISVVTNNNKVYRVMVADKNKRNESDIKIRFNFLCRQFQNNKRYTQILPYQTLSEEEDISYGILIHNKRYEAVFYQNSYLGDEEKTSYPNYNKSVWFMINKDSYGKYQILMYYDNEYNRANGEDL